MASAGGTAASCTTWQAPFWLVNTCADSSSTTTPTQSASSQAPMQFKPAVNCTAPFDCHLTAKRQHWLPHFLHDCQGGGKLMPISNSPCSAPADEKVGHGRTEMQKGWSGLREKVATPPRSIGKFPVHDTLSTSCCTSSACITIVLSNIRPPSGSTGSLALLMRQRYFCNYSRAVFSSLTLLHGYQLYC